MLLVGEYGTAKLNSLQILLLCALCALCGSFSWLSNRTLIKKMTFIKLKNHQVWHDLTEVLENIDTNAFIKEHLNLSDYKVYGYWDKADNYYDEIVLPTNLDTELISSSIGVNQNQRFILLKFILKVEINNQIRIGELTLIYNQNMEFINENWLLDTEFLENFK